MRISVFRIAVCDDESQDLKQIVQNTEGILEQEGISAQIDAFESSQELLDALRKQDHGYQLLLLDVVMEELNGMDLAEKIRQLGEEVSIIFISSSRDYAMMGYQVEAARYLEKPVKEDMLREALLFCWKRCVRKKELLVNTGKHMRKIPLDQLIYAETSGRGTLLTLRGETVWVKISVSELEQELIQPQFWRCHQSFLVNLSYVENLKRYELTLKGDLTVPVSKLRYDSTRNALFQFVSD